jgi:hypothetical protein
MVDALAQHAATGVADPAPGGSCLPETLIVTIKKSP